MTAELAGADVEILAYNYDQIDEAHRHEMIDAAVNIKRNLRQITEGMIEAGKRLIAIKEFLPEDTFGAWLETEFELSERMAQNMMTAAREYGSDPQRVAGFSSRAIYLMAAPSTPKKIRAKIEAKARKTGKPATHKEIVQELAAQRAQQQPPTPAETAPNDAESENQYIEPQTPPDVAEAGYSIVERVHPHYRKPHYQWRHASPYGRAANFGVLCPTLDAAIEDARDHIRRGVTFYASEPEKPNAVEAFDELRQKFGHHFDDVDPQAFVERIRRGEDDIPTDRNAARRAELQEHLDVHRASLALLPRSAELTGRHTRTLGARRELEKIIADLETNLEALKR